MKYTVWCVAYSITKHIYSKRKGIIYNVEGFLYFFYHIRDISHIVRDSMRSKTRKLVGKLQTVGIYCHNDMYL